MNQNSSIRMQVLCALFAAVTAVCSQITIPIQPVPITLGTFAVLMAGGFLGKRYGFLAIAIYLLLGMAGVPVFSMMRRGCAGRPWGRIYHDLPIYGFSGRFCGGKDGWIHFQAHGCGFFMC